MRLMFGVTMSGVLVFNDRQLTSGGAEVSMAHYLTSSQFTVDVAENWQSEFLAVAAMAAFSIYLRQRGSPESKPVGESHAATGIEG